MENLPILLMIVLIVIVIKNNNKLTEHLQKFEAELKLLRQLILKINIEKISLPDTITSTITTPTAPEENKYESLFSLDTEENPYPSAEVYRPEEASVNIAVNEEEEQNPLVVPFPESMEDNKVIEPAPTQQTPYIPPPPTPSFFERHPDMEKFIGENLINKIGIAILVLAIGYFVKYAIDQNWIGAIGRVAIGIFCGAILVGIAHKMNKNYKSFSSVLAGGGLAVFYFTITLAYHQFHLFSQITAFVIMTIITLFAVMLSLLYDRQEMAIIALVGGFAAPFLVNNGSGNYQGLFTYLIILNTGLLAIAYYKAWRLLNLLSFIFTVILFGSWLTLLKYKEPAATYRNAFVFASIFYLLYFVINIIHNIKEKKKFIVTDFGILLAGTTLYFATGIYSLNKMNAPEFKGLFSLLMAIFNLGSTYLLFRKQKVDTNILYLLIGITLTFISITAPLQLHGNYITLFWASEAVLLYWLFTKAKISIIQYASILVWGLMIISLIMDCSITYTSKNLPLTIIANKGFITNLFAAFATYLLFVLYHQQSKNVAIKEQPLVPDKLLYRISGVLILFMAGIIEINYQFNYYYPQTEFNALYLLLYMLVFILLLSLVTQKFETIKLKWQLLAWMFSICIFLYFIFETTMFNIQSQLLVEDKNSIHFMAHWLSALVFVCIFYKLKNLFEQNKISINENYNLLTWLSCGVAVSFVSSEILLLFNTTFYDVNNPLDNIQRIYVKAGLPIIWGICSFIFMYLGMLNKNKTLRIISLSLFSLTLLKLFLFDISNIPAGGKIAAFFCLGVLLLIVSFMYQRLKNIIKDDEEKVD